MQPSGVFFFGYGPHTKPGIPVYIDNFSVGCFHTKGGAS